eukprot:scaffold20331_cov30-Phaeocystis_antarctica.AAC.2
MSQKSCAASLVASSHAKISLKAHSRVPARCAASFSCHRSVKSCASRPCTTSRRSCTLSGAPPPLPRCHHRRADPGRVCVLCACSDLCFWPLDRARIRLRGFHALRSRAAHRERRVRVSPVGHGMCVSDEGRISAVRQCRGFVAQCW